MIINKELIMLSLSGTTKEEIIDQLASLAVKEKRINDLDTYKAAVLHREEEYSTAMGFGIAIPHGKSAAVTEPFLCFGMAKSVDWNSLDGSPVDLVFLIGVPETAGDTHLRILASLSRKLMKHEFRDGLRAITSPEEMITFLQNNEIGI
jgi:PTS system fructose-specific IIA component